MLWELAHCPRDVDEATRVELEAPSSGVAIEAAAALLQRCGED